MGPRAGLDVLLSLPDFETWIVHFGSYSVYRLRYPGSATDSNYALVRTNVKLDIFNHYDVTPLISDDSVK
jgi:hypothetical protein